MARGAVADGCGRQQGGERGRECHGQQRQGPRRPRLLAGGRGLAGRGAGKAGQARAAAVQPEGGPRGDGQGERSQEAGRAEMAPPWAIRAAKVACLEGGG